MCVCLWCVVIVVTYSIVHIVSLADVWLPSCDLSALSLPSYVLWRCVQRLRSQVGSEGLSVEGVNELPFLMPGRIGTVRFDVSIVFYVAIDRAFFSHLKG